MSELIRTIDQRPAGLSVSPRLAKALNRELTTLQARTVVDIARIDAAVQRREVAADGVTAIAGRAMQHVALVSQAEQNLAQAVPHASGRLAAIADAHALAMTSVVIETARALERLV